MQRQWSPAYMTVLADRSGADICAYRYGEVEDRDSVDGSEYPLARTKPGGWSQPRYQRRAENTWAHNARNVADEIVAMADRFQPCAIFLAGDVRAMQLMRDVLPDRLLNLLVPLEGSRAEDGSEDQFQQLAREQQRALAELAVESIAAKFREELGQQDRAVEGADETLAALGRAQVDVLLVGPQDDDQRTAYFGSEPTTVGRRPGDLVALGVDDAREGALVDVAVRAALGTDAAVCVVDERAVPTGGLGALLRWSLEGR
jgi:peptide subunit release factor 1 (eRF1)